jgi:hypothetical protein
MHALLLAALMANAGGPSTPAATKEQGEKTTETKALTSTTEKAAVSSSTKGADAGPAPLNLDDPHTQHLLLLGGGIGVGVVSAVAFTTGLDAERALQASVHSEADADTLLNKRTIAGWVAWPAALISLGAIGASALLLATEGSAP